MFRDKKKIQLCLLKGEIDLREELVETLLDGGFGVNGFSAARELHAALPVVPCDIVIIDTELPGEDCFSIAARLRSLGNVGIIILSARSETEDRVRALQGGADVYLTKPVDLRELVAVVTSLARRLERSEPKSIRKTEVTPSVWSLSAGGWVVRHRAKHHVFASHSTGTRFHDAIMGVRRRSGVT